MKKFFICCLLAMLFASCGDDAVIFSENEGIVFKIEQSASSEAFSPTFNKSRSEHKFIVHCITKKSVYAYELFGYAIYDEFIILSNKKYEIGDTVRIQ